MDCTKIHSRGTLCTTLPRLFWGVELPLEFRGLPFMTSALEGGGGSWKSRWRYRRLRECDSDKGGGGQKIREFCGCYIWKAPYRLRHPHYLLISGVKWVSRLVAELPSIPQDRATLSPLFWKISPGLKHCCTASDCIQGNIIGNCVSVHAKLRS